AAPFPSGPRAWTASVARRPGAASAGEMTTVKPCSSPRPPLAREGRAERSALQRDPGGRKRAPTKPGVGVPSDNRTFRTSEKGGLAVVRPSGQGALAFWVDRKKRISAEGRSRCVSGSARSLRGKSTVG